MFKMDGSCVKKYSRNVFKINQSWKNCIFLDLSFFPYLLIVVRKSSYQNRWDDIFFELTHQQTMISMIVCVKWLNCESKSSLNSSWESCSKYSPLETFDIFRAGFEPAHILTHLAKL